MKLKNSWKVIVNVTAWDAAARVARRHQAVLAVYIGAHLRPTVYWIRETLAALRDHIGTTRSHLVLKKKLVFSSIMEYATPQKLPDGRYFLKITGARHQVNGLILQDSLASKSVNFKTDSNLFSVIDEQILTQAKLSKQEWFGKELSDETIQNAWQESVTDGVLGASLATVKGQVAVSYTHLTLPTNREV